MDQTSGDSQHRLKPVAEVLFKLDLDSIDYSIATNRARVRDHAQLQLYLFCRGSRQGMTIEELRRILGGFSKPELETPKLIAYLEEMPALLLAESSLTPQTPATTRPPRAEIAKLRSLYSAHIEKQCQDEFELSNLRTLRHIKQGIRAMSDLTEEVPASR